MSNKLTPQKAIQILKTEYLGDSELMELAKQMGAQALTKEIPMKCTGISKKEYIDGYCPNCLTRQALGSLDWKITFNKFCRECGQALDWSDTNA